MFVTSFSNNEKPGLEFQSGDMQKKKFEKPSPGWEQGKKEKSSLYHSKKKPKKQKTDLNIQYTSRYLFFFHWRVYPHNSTFKSYSNWLFPPFRVVIFSFEIHFVSFVSFYSAVGFCHSWFFAFFFFFSLLYKTLAWFENSELYKKVCSVEHLSSFPFSVPSFPSPVLSTPTCPACPDHLSLLSILFCFCTKEQINTHTFLFSLPSYIKGSTL